VLRITSPQLMRKVSIITTRGQKLSPASLRLVQLLKQLLPDGEERRKSRASSSILEL